MQTYRSRINSVNQENEDLKASNAEMQKSKAQVQEENEQLKRHLG